MGKTPRLLQPFLSCGVLQGAAAVRGSRRAAAACPVSPVACVLCPPGPPWAEGARRSGDHAEPSSLSAGVGEPEVLASAGEEGWVPEEDEEASNLTGGRDLLVACLHF